MPDPIDPDKLQSVSEAVQVLQKTIDEVKEGLPSAEQQALFEKIEPTFAAFDKLGEKMTQSEKDALELKGEMADLKETLEEKDASAATMSAEIETLQADVARRQSDRKEDPKAFKKGDEWKAFNKWAREGVEAMGSELKAGTLRTDVNVTGGFLTGVEFEAELTRIVTELNNMRGLARVTSIAGPEIEVPVRTTLPVAVYKGQTEDTSKTSSNFETNTIRPIRVSLQTGATQQALSHTEYDLDSEMSRDAGLAFAVAEGVGNVTGSGSGEPQGFLDASAGVTLFPSTATLSGTIDGDDLMKLMGEIKDGYEPTMVMNRRTLAKLRTLRAGSGFAADDGKGNYLWDPALNGPATGELAGMPYSIMPAMPDLSADSKSVAIGDWFRSFRIVDTLGLMMVRDPFTEAGQNIVVLTWHRFNTSQVIIAEGIRILTSKS